VAKPRSNPSGEDLHRYIFTPEAEEQLAKRYRDIAEYGSREIALSYTNAVVDYCEGLQVAGHRGTRRDDSRPGLRITHYKGRTAIALAVEGEQVFILGVFHGGQDYESALRPEPDG